MIFNDTADTVAKANEQVAQQWRDMMLVGDLDGGADRMRWRGEQWLPKFEREEDGQYLARLSGTDLYPGFTAALDDAVARPFSKAVEVEKLPAVLEPILPNVDGEGSDLTQFARRFMRSGVKYGRAHVLIDYTAKDPTLPNTRAAEAATGPRPWWRLIEAPNLIGWRSFILPNGQPALSEIRIHEIRGVPDGKWGEKKAEFIRVVRRDSFELYQNLLYQPAPYAADWTSGARFYDWQDGRQHNFVKVDEGAFGPEGGFDSVPLVTIYTAHRGFMVARPALIDLAETNLTHWKSSSDQRNILHVARVPILFSVGMESNEKRGGITIGANAGVATMNADADLRYVEHTGMSIEAGRQDLMDLEARMAMLGVRPQLEKTGDITATASALSASGADTDVQAWAAATDTGLEQCFALSAKWLGIEMPEDFDVRIFKDYMVKLADEKDLATLDSARGRKDITNELYLLELKRRGVLGDDVDAEEEAGKAEGERQADHENAMALASAAPAGKSGEGEPGGREGPRKAA